MYVEGDVPVMTYGNCNNGNGFGNGWEGLIGLALVAGLFDNGNGGLFGGNRGGNGFCTAGLATQADLSAGFANSEIMSDLNTIINSLTQGFAGINTAIANATSTLGFNMAEGFHGVDNAICTLGYNVQSGFNGIANQIASCCCDLKQLNLENRYLNEKQTCEIVNAINAGNQRLVDIYNADKMASKDARIAALESVLSNREQTAEILKAVNRDRCPEPAYIVPNPNCCYNPFGFGFGGGCCGASVQ